MSLWGCEELYVTGLPGDVTEPELRGLFGAHGVVKEAVIVNKKAPSVPGAPQSCIVRMAAHVDAVRAKKALHKYDWMGKQIAVKWSHNQRVVWVGNLHDNVTNEVLFAAFSHFGAVHKAVVACDAPNNASRGWGFVSFENKRFAVKAIETCRAQPFLVHPGHKPVVVDWARNDEMIEGFSEEVRTGNKGPPPAPILPESAAHLPPPNSKEGLQAGRMLALRGEYEELKRLLKARLMEAEAHVVVTGNAPRLLHMLVPDAPYGPPGGAPGPFMAPPPGMGAARPPLGPQGLGGPMGQAGPAAGPMGQAAYGGGFAPGPAPVLPIKRELGGSEAFHSVPPPPKRAMYGTTDRFNPNPNQLLIKQEPQQAAVPQGPAPPPLPPQRPTSAFVRGGELHTVNQNGGDGRGQQQQQQQQPHDGGGSGGGGAAGEHGHGEGGTAPPAVGAKPPGSHDHGGIGFSGPPAPPPGKAAAGTAAAGAAASGAPATAAQSYDAISSTGSAGAGAGASAIRAPYMAYQYPYGGAATTVQSQSLPQQPSPPAATSPAGAGGYGAVQQQHQYGMYGAQVAPPPPPQQQQQLSLPHLPQQQQPQQAYAQQAAYPPRDQQQQQQQQYAAYANYNYYQAPQQQQQMQAGGGAPMQAPYGMASMGPPAPPLPPQQQQMYGAPPLPGQQQGYPQMPGQGYY